MQTDNTFTHISAIFITYSEDIHYKIIREGKILIPFDFVPALKYAKALVLELSNRVVMYVEISKSIIKNDGDVQFIECFVSKCFHYGKDGGVPSEHVLAEQYDESKNKKICLLIKPAVLLNKEHNYRDFSDDKEVRILDIKKAKENLAFTYDVTPAQVQITITSN